MWLLTVFIVVQGTPQRLEIVYSSHTTQQQCVAKGWEAMKYGAIDFNCVPDRR